VTYKNSYPTHIIEVQEIFPYTIDVEEREESEELHIIEVNVHPHKHLPKGSFVEAYLGIHFILMKLKLHKFKLFCIIVHPFSYLEPASQAFREIAHA
jgi:hypothetical protein